ncbi:uncharacterized protein FIBRA_07491 [Fibroporia radiculosa]|uniref:C2H2-type domain-containing protein n=1 Tax=Fibroporia radiculosa TaxID=599839 RepID=J4H4N1_9APHY|nr:uncharacterized protein FIBRA_07491 [Fibroporia radiculosa]CCM05279.1 predicted protein [Fibroporia radiculosa]
MVFSSSVLLVQHHMLHYNQAMATLQLAQIGLELQYYHTQLAQLQQYFHNSPQPPIERSVQSAPGHERDVHDDDNLDGIEGYHYCCHLCIKFYDDHLTLQAHCREEHPLYCGTCRRWFKNESGLEGHLKSSIHQERTLACPGRLCTKLFLSGAGLVNHLESGACRSGVSRQQINCLAIQYDKNNIITNPARLIHGSDGYAAPESVVTIWATESAFNGRMYECLLCHREFRKLHSLNEHLGSPAHDEEIYRCPKDWQGCGAEFRTLSALCQHVESESCGIRRFKDPMENVIGSISGSMKKLVL